MVTMMSSSYEFKLTNQGHGLWPGRFGHSVDLEDRDVKIEKEFQN